MDQQLRHEAVENLVTQFSSALDFFRELVQNSIDAGSANIDVWMEYEAGSGAEGVIAIHVDDYGEGMNEAIIDQQLTCLFSSTKENDLTKIGKFGIGFVSVFALKPAGVLIHTGRDGESWEVFFHEDRSFTKTRIDTPVEGTQITLFVPGDRSRYRELVNGSRATLKRWCSHSDTEVTFEDRSAADGVGRGLEVINEPFAPPGAIGVQIEHPGTELALAYSEHPVYGFYNKGLALAVTEAAQDVLDTRADRYRTVAFKIKSRYLEHTLSRETVMRDDNYEKAMALLDQAANGPLRDALIDALQVAAAREPWDLAARTHYQRLVGFLLTEPTDRLPELVQRPILRTVTGRVLPPKAVEQALSRDGWIYVAPAPSRLTAMLEDEGIPVWLGLPHEGHGDSIKLLLSHYLAAEASSGLWGKLQQRWGKNHFAEASARVVHPEDVRVTVHLDVAVSGAQADLLERAARLLQEVEAGYRELRGGRIEGQPDQPHLFVLGRELRPVMALPPGGVYERGFLERPRAVVNLEHPHVRALLDLHGRSPALAGYALAKALLLQEDRDLHKDLQLAEQASAEVRA